MNSVRIVKRKEREAANNLVVVHQTMAPARMTPEMVVKSWITATRERHQAKMKAFLLDIKSGQGNLCLVVSD